MCTTLNLYFQTEKNQIWVKFPANEVACSIMLSDLRTSHIHRLLKNIFSMSDAEYTDNLNCFQTYIVDHIARILLERTGRD